MSIWDDAEKKKRSDREKRGADLLAAETERERMLSDGSEWQRRFLEEMGRIVEERRESVLEDRPVFERLGRDDARVRTNRANLRATFDFGVSPASVAVTTSWINLQGSQEEDVESFTLVRSGPTVAALRSPRPRAGDGDTPEEMARAIMRSLAYRSA